MHNKSYFALLPLSFFISNSFAEDMQSVTLLDPIVVTGVTQTNTNSVKLNPKTTLQPLPAGDGADLLHSVANMSVIRKGGSSGDPLFRGLGGSRLNIQADDQFIYGGCSNRMDPPTAYIFPSAYDEVVVTKGPQTVTQGTGLVAGAVHFVRKEPEFDTQNTYLNGSVTLGGNKRRDAYFDAMAGGKYGYLRTSVSHNEAGDYKDGDGNRVHSSFERRNQMLQLGFTPTENTLLTGTYERSRGEAAYADRMMDGSKFDRDAWNIRLVQRNITPWFTELELRYGQSKIDHVMDTYSMRYLSMMGNQVKKAMNPKRETNTGHLKATFDWPDINLQIGIDYMRDKHLARMEMKWEGYTHKPYQPQQNFTQWGGFVEGAWTASDSRKFISGYRYDEVKAEYDTLMANHPNKHHTYGLHSGFLRWEEEINGIKYYAGVGIAERAPDYWERRASQVLDKEQNRQIDTGLIWKSDAFDFSVSLFGSDVHDFIMLERVGKNISARNIKATRLGGEIEGKWRFARHWEIGSSLAYTYGKDRTDDRPLAQTPPLEWKNSLTWGNETLSAGVLWRLVSAQKRYAAGQGNIIGQDIGASAGFGTLSFNTGWKINKYATLQGGIDNLFNKSYAEFVSKGADPSAGLQTVRVNEPGRQYWLRLQVQF